MLLCSKTFMNNIVLSFAKISISILSFIEIFTARVPFSYGVWRGYGSVSFIRMRFVEFLQMDKPKNFLSVNTWTNANQGKSD